MIKGEIREKIRDSLEDLYGETVELSDLSLEVPTDESHGDYSSNISFKLAGKLKKNPKETASELAGHLSGDLFDCQNKNGFLNFYLTDSALEMIVRKTLEFNFKDKDKTMVLDYSAPNIAKPFGIGHLRSTIVGQAIYNIYTFSGWNCVGVNHLGDWGTQYGKLLYQIIENDLNPEDLSVKDLEKLYVDFHEKVKNNPEIEEKARDWFKKLEEGEDRAVDIWKACVLESLKEFDKTYHLLGVDIDYNMGESFYKDKTEDIIKEAKEKKIATESEGALIIDFNDKKIPPAMLLKSDGATTYFTRDLAAVKYRIERWDPDLLVYEIGADQKLHMRQLFKAVNLFGWKEVSFKHVAHGMYRLKEGSMSTRKGRTIHLEDVLQKAIEKAEEIVNSSENCVDFSNDKKRKIAEKIGVGAIKYADLKKHYKKDIVFNWDKILSLKGNSGPYLQYSLLRAKGVLKKANQDFSFEINNLSKEERSLLRKVTEFSQAVEVARKNFTPSVIANYAYELAKEFNYFYAEFPIIGASSKKEKIKRLSITQSVFEVLEKSLELLGIPIPEKM